LASEPADVLIVGAGATGGVVARRLTEAGFAVVCLEQGDWHDKAEYRGNQLDWELTMRKQWATSPNVRELPEDYPIDETDSDLSPLMYSAVGGSMIIYAGAWPRMLPSDFRVRSLDGIADDWPLTYDELLPYYEHSDRHFGVSGMGGDPAYPAGGEDPPLPPLPLGAGGLRSPAPTTASAGTGGRSRMPSCRRPTTGAARASSAAPASRAATRAPRPPPTSPTGRRRSPPARVW
jgi:choline dehydrogenase-like flavoprotein